MSRQTAVSGPHTCPRCDGTGALVYTSLEALWRAHDPAIRRTRRLGHGRAIRLIRERLGWTQKQVAAELLLTRSAVKNLESGQEVLTPVSAAVYAVLARRAGLERIAEVLEAT